MELNKIYNENNLDTLKRMPDNFIDLVVTSPPYDNLRDYNGYSFDFESLAKELFRIVKNGGVVVWVVNDTTTDGDRSGTSFKQALFFKECGFKLFDVMIYRKRGSRNTHTNRYTNCFEYMFILTKGNIKTTNLIKIKRDSLVKKRSNVRTKDGKKIYENRKHYKVLDEIPDYNIWEFAVGFNNSTKDVIAYDHPAIFPEKLAARHIQSWSNEGDLVYDPFMGSGTTAKMCILLKRNFIGSEISEEYTNIANKRIEIYKNQTQIF